MNHKNVIPVTLTDSEQLVATIGKAVTLAEEWQDAIQIAHDKAVVSYNAYDEAIIAVDDMRIQTGDTQDLRKSRHQLSANRAYMSGVVNMLKKMGAKA
jgi:hypothetical protein